MLKLLEEGLLHLDGVPERVPGSGQAALLPDQLAHVPADAVCHSVERFPEHVQFGDMHVGDAEIVITVRDPRGDIAHPPDMFTEHRGDHGTHQQRQQEKDQAEGQNNLRETPLLEAHEIHRLRDPDDGGYRLLITQGLGRVQIFDACGGAFPGGDADFSRKGFPDFLSSRVILHSRGVVHRGIGDDRAVRADYGDPQSIDSGERFDSAGQGWIRQTKRAFIDQEHDIGARGDQVALLDLHAVVPIPDCAEAYAERQGDKGWNEDAQHQIDRKSGFRHPHTFHPLLISIAILEGLRNGNSATAWRGATKWPRLWHHRVRATANRRLAASGV